MLIQKVVVIEMHDAYIGYVDPSVNWNGWACPNFEFDEAMAVMHDHNQGVGDHKIWYDKIYDQFVLQTDAGDFDIWRGVDVPTEHGIKHLYDIIGCNVWDIINSHNILSVAIKIEDFLFEYDTYEHRDQYDDRDAVTEEIKTQLKDLNILKQAIKIIYNEYLTEDEIFAQLGGILKI